MTATTLSQPLAGRARLSPLMVGIVALAAFAGGLGVAKIVPTTSSAAASVTQAGPAFNAVQFRAEEHAAWGAAPGFDAVQFRAGEHAAGNAAPAFDAVQFRAEERQP